MRAAISPPKSLGQVSIEFILLTVVVTSFSLFAAKEIRNREYLAKLITGPWSYMTGMIENGVWGDPRQTKSKHPGYLMRHNSHLPESGRDL